jgi:hypothetical protein
MVTVLEEDTTEEQRSIVLFLWSKGLNAKDIHRETFPAYGGKHLSRKAVHNWVDEEVETKVRKWLKQQSKDFYVAGFDAQVRRWDKCISVGGEYFCTSVSLGRS